MDSFETSLNNTKNLEISLETLELLEWPTVCSHLSTFAVTEQGRRRCKEFTLPSSKHLSEDQLSQTQGVSFGLYLSPVLHFLPGQP